MGTSGVYGNTTGSNIIRHLHGEEYSSLAAPDRDTQTLLSIENIAMYKQNWHLHSKHICSV